MTRDLQPPSMSAHLMGVIDFGAALALQQRLVYETAGRDDGHVTLLVCEHAPLVTIGRQGSTADVRLSPRQLASERLEVRWVNRGGGAILHLPGQLALYPIVPLEWHGYAVGEYLDRLEDGLAAALAECGVTNRRDSSARGIWGRSGQLAALGTACKGWVTYFGAYLNVDPAMALMRHVLSDTAQREPLSSLAVERQQPTRMTTIRESVVRHLSHTLVGGRYHIHTGHPLLGRLPLTIKTARAG